MSVWARERPQMYVIDDELKEFVESGVATIIGTVDRAGRPHIVFGWGARVGEDRTSVTVFVEEARASRPFSNLAETATVAMTVTSPVSYRSVQFKGALLATGSAEAADEPWVQKQRDAFQVETMLVGDSPQSMKNMAMSGPLVWLRFKTERAFDQTPGPEAGLPL